MTIQKAIQNAREINHAMIAAKRGELPLTVQALRNRREYLVEFARFYR